MKIERICKNCGDNFFAQKLKQYFCSRRCFKQDYAKKRKTEFINVFPVYNCSKCNKQTHLNFDPMENSDKWMEFECPHCSDPNRNIQIIVSSEIFIVF